MGCLKLTKEDNTRINKMLFEKIFGKKKDTNEQFTDKVAERVKDDVAEQVKNDISEDVKAIVIEQVKKDITEQIKKDIIQEVRKEIKLKNFFRIENVTDFIAVAASIIVIGIFVGSVHSLGQEVDEMSTQVATIYGDLYLNNGIIDQLEDVQEEIEKDNQKDAKLLIADENIAVVLEDVSVVGNNISHTTSSLSAEMPIGIDNKGKVYYAGELIGENVLLVYKDEGKEVLFVGQYNESYHWDGYCVTNAYNPDGTLYGICESNFQDGKRLDYKTVLAVGENEWDYYSRKCNGESNIGISIEYSLHYDRIKNFNISNANGMDVLYADDFIKNHDAVMLQYYYGNTSDEKYNDDSGEAYLIKFDDDETVRMLYVGRFVDGKLEDYTGDAWNIAYWDKGKAYVCNTGKFRNNSAMEHSDEKITQEIINEKIKGVDIPFKLKWKENE